MKCKPVLSFVLVAVLIISLSTPAFATQIHANDMCCVEEHGLAYENATPADEEYDASAAHVCNGPIISSAAVGNKYKSRTSSSCVKYFKHTRKCSTCETKYYEYQWASSATAHISTVYDATCNGTTQTLYNWCYCCHYKLSNTQRTCPGGPHTGGCSYLPA